MNVDKHLNYKVLDCTTTVADNPLENRAAGCRTVCALVLSFSDWMEEMFSQ